jgi:HAD superfamily hydrolase (TIGR01509 family)
MHTPQQCLQDARVVIFDVDGTLYDGRALRRRMIAELLFYCFANPRQSGLLQTLRIYRRERERLADAEATGIIAQQYARPAELLGISPQTVEARITPWIHQRPLRHLSVRRIPGIRRLFDELRAAGKILAVYSDYPAEEKLVALELRADEVVTATDAEVNRLKPHPAGLEVLLRRLDASPSKCLLFGDRDSRDGAAARRLGMPYLLRGADPRDPHTDYSDYRQFLGLAGQQSS